MRCCPQLRASAMQHTETLDLKRGKSWSDKQPTSVLRKRAFRSAMTSLWRRASPRRACTACAACMRSCCADRLWRSPASACRRATGNTDGASQRAGSCATGRTTTQEIRRHPAAFSPRRRLAVAMLRCQRAASCAWRLASQVSGVGGLSVMSAHCCHQHRVLR